MVTVKPAPSSVLRHTSVRREFRHMTAMIRKRPISSTKALLSWIGLAGFFLTFLIMVIPLMSEPESIEDIIKHTLLSPSRLDNYIVKKLRWSKVYLKVLSLHENEAAGTYKKLLQNHLNSRRVVDIIKQESETGRAKTETAKRCRRVIPDCSQLPYNLKGRLSIEKWMTNTPINENRHFLRTHERVWSTRYCVGRHSVAVIIPFRGREKQLGILLHHLPTILKRQRINYSIFVIEQAGNTTFNKGILMNAGFLTALTRPGHGVTFQCFIFHDVDLLAEDDRNMYTCPERPRHMSVAVDEFDYKLPYLELLGGVFAIKTEHFIEVNGYSNSYWGWGGEDDDMGLRVKSAFGGVSRPSQSIGRYSSVQHTKMKPVFPLYVRRKLKKMTRIRYKIDGLNTVKYSLVNVEEKYQYTHVLVDVGLPPKEVDGVGLKDDFYVLNTKPKTAPPLDH